MKKRVNKLFFIIILILLLVLITIVFFFFFKHIRNSSLSYVDELKLDDSFKLKGDYKTNIFNQNFLEDSEIKIKLDKPVDSFGIEGKIDLKNSDSFVQIILEDDKGDKKLIYEGYPLIAKEGKFKLSNVCEETCFLNSFNASKLKIHAVNASVSLFSFSYSSSEDKSDDQTKSKEIDLSNENLKKKQIKFKIDVMNEKIKDYNLSWVAGETPLVNLSLDDKLDYFGTDFVPNLQGFDYYKGGIFEKPSELFVPEIIPLKIRNFPGGFNWKYVNGQNWLTSIKDQSYPKKCASCWAFSSTAAVEAVTNVYFNKHLDLNLSEQDLLSCSKAGDCSGGFINETLYYVENKGIGFESCFPYIASPVNCGYKGNLCKNSIDFNSVVKIYGRENFDVNQGFYWFKEKLITNGPIVLGINSWNHAVLLNGWSTDNKNETVWEFKNSWGNQWGNEGFGKIKLKNLNDLKQHTYAIISPITLPKNYDDSIVCLDRDGDHYCDWGISKEKPSSCPSYCKSEKDCYDWNDSYGAFYGPYDPDYRCIKINYTVVNLIPPKPVPIISCLDLDDGFNVNIKSSLTDSSGTYEDTCINSSVLRERICFNDSLMNRDYFCEFGCFNGACKTKFDLNKLNCSHDYLTDRHVGRCDPTNCRSDEYLDCIPAGSANQEKCRNYYLTFCSESPVCNEGDLQVSNFVC